jgi:hypothetical protein
MRGVARAFAYRMAAYRSLIVIAWIAKSFTCVLACLLNWVSYRIANPARLLVNDKKGICVWTAIPFLSQATNAFWRLGKRGRSA